MVHNFYSCNSSTQLLARLHVRIYLTFSVECRNYTFTSFVRSYRGWPLSPLPSPTPPTMFSPKLLTYTMFFSTALSLHYFSFCSCRTCPASKNQAREEKTLMPSFSASASACLLLTAAFPSLAGHPLLPSGSLLPERPWHLLSWCYCCYPNIFLRTSPVSERCNVMFFPFFFMCVWNETPRTDLWVLLNITHLEKKMFVERYCSS